uniref:Histo-blood group ABO system transferase n=1 Tax=Ursus maritimus TaxID=29073 RepID=A0A452UVW2_URSMA
MARLVRTVAENPKCYLPHRVIVLLLIALALAFCYCYLNPRNQILGSISARTNKVISKIYGLESIKLSKMVYPQPDVLTPSRKDVLIMTPWLAPIIWEGTFNMDILNEQFRLQNATIGLIVFPTEKYFLYLRAFLETAEMYFMVGHRVNYYVFTDKPEYVPHLNVRNGRQIIILKIQSYARWQDISMHRMEMLSTFSRQRFQREVDYLVCADVDMRLSDHVGVEVLSSLFGTLHVGYYGLNRADFPYERRPQSQAHIPEDEGDFYYIGALFGGSVSEVARLTEACHRAIMVDQANHIEAIWHDESHLNKYFLYHKPSKVLSPEYLWYQQQMNYVKDQNSTALPSVHWGRAGLLHVSPTPSLPAWVPHSVEQFSN